MDWTYCSPYKGNILSIGDYLQHQKIYFLDKYFQELKYDTKEFKIQRNKNENGTEIKIPLEMLQPSNPVIFYDEIVFFEDELADRGFSKLNIRFRVMKDCWFILLRSYVRLDQVKVRILDTRIFHQFDNKNRVIRDFTFLEEKWDNLRLKGF